VTAFDAGQLTLFQAGGTSVVDRTRVSTNTLSHRVGVQRWANFIAGFSVEFVQECLAASGRKGVVLDPFMGCGTTGVGARMSGLDCVGYDPHPVFGTLADAKVQAWSNDDLDHVLAVMGREKRPREMSPSVVKFLSKLFSEENLSEVMIASRALDRLDARRHSLGVAVLLKASELACSSQTDGIYKAPTTQKRSVTFKAALADAASVFREDIAAPWYRPWTEAGDCRLYRKSSTEMSELEACSIATVVTSPPYLNNFDFAEMTRMQLYILGIASSWSEITETVREKLITNTTTAPKTHRDVEYQKQCRESIPLQLASSLDAVVERLASEKTKRAGKKPYDSLVFPYYRQIADVLRECHRVLQPSGALNWVVSDAALYGTYIPTHEHTATLLQSIGFRNIEVHQLRKRGHRWKLDKRDGAPGRLGEYHIFGVKK